MSDSMEASQQHSGPNLRVEIENIVIDCSAIGAGTGM